MDNHTKNIYNLISLWETVANSFQKLYIQNELAYCQIESSEWPNRVWFTKEVTPNMIKTATDIIRNSAVPLSISYWSGFEKDVHPLFEKFGFIKKSEQTGMSLELRRKFRQEENKISLQKLMQQKDVKIWTSIYPKSFKYKISEQLIEDTKHLIDYFLIYHNKQAIGTIITHQTGNVMGIHGLSIINEFRKQGYAEAAMIAILNNSLEKNMNIAVLQSSAMGKNIYLNLGFTEDFSITNYKLK